MLGLTDQYESLVRIWGTMPDLTAERAIQMLRTDAQREEDRERIKSGHTFAATSGHDHSPEIGMAAMGHKRRAIRIQVSGKRTALDCKACGKHPQGTICYASTPCGFCGRTGHPEFRCYDKQEQERQRGGPATGSNATGTTSSRVYNDGPEEVLC